MTATGGNTYHYDANGNMTSDSLGRKITYSPFDKAVKIEKSVDEWVSFAYGTDRRRYQRVDSTASGTTTTWYLGSVEKVVGNDGSVTYKRYLTDYSLLIEHYSSSGQLLSREENYLLKDHLGSIDVIMAADGTVQERLGFDAWGQRRLAATGAVLGSVLPSFTSRTTRGYTGHEMVDSMGIIHMNGRIYDPKLGRFLQADPILQFPGDTQSYNRYSYVLNNPLKYNDPSGHFIPIAFAWGLAAWGASGYLAVGALVAGLAAAVEARMNGASWSDALRSGLITGVSFAAFGYFGGPPVGTGFGELVLYGLKMGAIGGVTSVLQGGKFGHGFVSAGFGAALGAGIGPVSAGGAVVNPGRLLGHMVVAGTLSKVTGGKFANGAVMAAFSAALNLANSRGNTGKNHQDLNTPSPQYGGTGVSAGDESKMAAHAQQTHVDEAKPAGDRANFPEPRAAAYSSQGIVENVRVTAQRLDGCIRLQGSCYLGFASGTLFSTSYGPVKRDGIYDMVELTMNYTVKPALIVAGGPVGLLGNALDIGQNFHSVFAENSSGLSRFMGGASLVVGRLPGGDIWRAGSGLYMQAANDLWGGE